MEKFKAEPQDFLAVIKGVAISLISSYEKVDPDLKRILIQT